MNTTPVMAKQPTKKSLRKLAGALLTLLYKITLILAAFAAEGVRLLVCGMREAMAESTYEPEEELTFAQQMAIQELGPDGRDNKYKYYKYW